MLILRYVAATVVASACFVLLLVASTIQETWGNMSSDIIWSDFAVTPVIFMIVALIAVTLAAPYATIAILFARRTGVNGYIYWIVIGIIAGLTAATSCAWVFNTGVPSIGDDGAEISFATEWWHLSPISLIAGGIGGFVFRWIEDRSWSYARR